MSIPASIEYFRLGTALLPLIPEFLIQMAVGSLLGYFMGRAIVLITNRMRLDYEGLYPVPTVSLMMLTYAGTAALQSD